MTGRPNRNRLVAAVARHWPYLLLLCAGAAYLVVLALLHHRSLGTGYDLGIYDQVVWNMSHGRLFETTLVYETGGTYDHLEPVLMLIAPIYRLFPDVRVLLILQSIALALGSAPIYLYARHHFAQLGVKDMLVALLPAAAYLIYPPLHAANLNDFHEVALLPPLLGMALFGLLTGRRKLLWVSLACCLLVKEDVTVTVLAFGVYIAVLRPAGFRRRDGVVLSLLALAWGVLVLYVLYPTMTRGMPYPFVERRYSWLGVSPTDAAKGLLSQPAVAIARILQPPKLKFLYQLFSPLLFLPLFGWPIIGLSLPVLVYLMMSDYQPQWSVGSYYNPPLLAFLFFATIQALGHLARRTRRWGWPARPVLTTSLFILFGVVVYSYFAAVRGPESHFFFPASLSVTDRAEAAGQLLAQVPPDAAVSADWSLVSHLSHRQRIFTPLARPLDPPEYRIVELRDTNEGAPIYPFAAPDNWPPIYHEYQPIATAAPFQLSKLARSITLAPIAPLEPRPAPLDVAAYAWLDAAQSPGSSPMVRPGETARLMLAWRRTGDLNRRYVLFVHVLADDSPAAANGLPDIIAQSGHEPGNGDFPTTFWQTWTQPRIILDEQRLEIPAGTQPGTYYVWAGAFDKATGDRLELGGSGKTLRLVTTLTVAP